MVLIASLVRPAMCCEATQPRRGQASFLPDLLFSSAPWEVSAFLDPCGVPRQRHQPINAIRLSTPKAILSAVLKSAEKSSIGLNKKAPSGLTMVAYVGELS